MILRSHHGSWEAQYLSVLGRILSQGVQVSREELALVPLWQPLQNLVKHAHKAKPKYLRSCPHLRRQEYNHQG